VLAGEQTELRVTILQHGRRDRELKLQRGAALTTPALGAVAAPAVGGDCGWAEGGGGSTSVDDQFEVLGLAQARPQLTGQRQPADRAVLLA
jgi:hypothetical protein